MKVLVVGATGKVGSCAVAALTAAGHRVTALARHVPKSAFDAVFHRADISDVVAMAEAARDQEAAFLITPNCESELPLATGAISAFESVGLPRLVYLGINGAAARSEVPHIGYKVRIAERLSRSEMKCVTLAAGYFFQNDAGLLPIIKATGLYPTPLGNVGVGAVDVRDIADALVRVLAAPPAASATIPIVGGEALTGDAIAGIWSEALGQSVRYGGDDTSGFAAALSRAGATAWLVDDLCQMMRHGQRAGSLPTAAQIAEARAAIGHPALSYRDFAAELRDAA